MAEKSRKFVATAPFALPGRDYAEGDEFVPPAGWEMNERKSAGAGRVAFTTPEGRTLWLPLDEPAAPAKPAPAPAKPARAQTAKKAEPPEPPAPAEDEPEKEETPAKPAAKKGD